MSNRRMILSVEMLNVYQQDANKNCKDEDQGAERKRQNSDALYEHDHNPIYELGYN